MRTLRDAADLLASADTIDSLAPIAAAIGCAGHPSPLDVPTRRSLGLDEALIEARVAAGGGALRALLADVRPDVAIRDMLSRIAGRLATRAPHVLWIVLATQRDTADVAITAWTGDRHPPRIAALVANRARLVDSDAETLRALAAAAGGSDLVTHARWVEILGRGALSVRFYRALERAVVAITDSSNVGPRDTRAEIALLNTSRLLFLSFLEAKGWLDDDRAFISHQFERCMTDGRRFHDRVLRPLFFGTLNTPARRRAPAARAFGKVPFLNGGLFARTPLERRWRDIAFSDDAYGSLIYDVFAQYRFTALEETASWSEAAVDPEMLGRAFESLMVSHERRRTGAFFTPFSLVERVTASGLEIAMGDQLASALDGGALTVHQRQAARKRLRDVSVLDPACGSGAFLVHVLERVATLLVQCGDARDLSAVRREVLTRSIFGVDVNPTAVWLCQLRLWLSVVIESSANDPSAVAPLPNLDRNIRAGDSLAGRAFGDTVTRARDGAAIRRLRERYANASGVRKETLSRQLERAERERALAAIDAEIVLTGARRRDLVVAQRGRDLFGQRYHPARDERLVATTLKRRSAALRALRRRIVAGGSLPFSFPVYFADVATRGGFNLIVGNPPWVRLHHVALTERIAFRRTFDVARLAGWAPGALTASAGVGFAGQVDVAALFVERSVRLLAQDGALALLLPVKLWRSLAGGGVRRFLADETRIWRIEDFSDAPTVFDAAVYPSLLSAQRDTRSQTPECIDLALHHRGRDVFGWKTTRDTLAFDSSPGAPWILLPPPARHAFDRLRAAGTPLAQSVIGRPYLGVKCGCNDAFIVELLDADEDLAEVLTSDGRRVTIEQSLVRPLLRGEHLERWRPPSSGESIVWTHDAHDAPLAQLPPHANRVLSRWRRQLIARTDSRGRARWWTLFRTESARFDRPRVIWGDVGREPRASVLDAGDRTVPLNSCYVTRCQDATDAHALTALLNGPVARAWLDAVAEPARGGYKRYFGWTMSLLPVPADWSRARAVLAPLGERARCGSPPSELELLDAALAAYGLEAEVVAPLVAWTSA